MNDFVINGNPNTRYDKKEATFMTKKYLIKLGAPILALSLVAACGNNNDEDPIDDNAPVEDENPVDEAPAEDPMDDEAPLTDENEAPLNQEDDNGNDNPAEDNGLDNQNDDPNLNKDDDNRDNQ